jgi:phenylalanyl-tRNA synthetase beta chain
MRISLSWLADFLPQITSVSYTPQILADALTSGGLEVEGIEEQVAIPGGLENVVVGHVLEVTAHPGADRLRICRVNTGGSEPVQIVCGAANVAQGQKVIVALPGSTLYPTGNTEPLKIKTGKIRGEVSAGMICAEDELGIGTSHEGILVLDAVWEPGVPAAKALGLEADHILEIGLTPNRGDAASHLGVARDLAALLQVELTNSKDLLSKDLSPSPLFAHIDHAPDAPHYHALLLEGVTVAPSPDWLQKRLNTLGIAAINNVVDITNYLCHYMGQPMHVFDADKVAGKVLTVRRAGMATTLALLDKRTVTLHPEDLVIADASGPIALAGAMGGIATSVTDVTQNVILEVACFHPVAVRKTAARHGLKTDSSFRFERGVDPALGMVALAKAVSLLQDHASAKVVTAPAVAQGKFPEAKTISIDFKKLTNLIGQPLEETLVKDILRRLGFGVSEDTTNFLVTVPSHRLYDVEGMADIAEEVIRIYGLNNLALPANIGVRFFDHAPGWKTFDKQAEVGRQLAAEGYVELVTNSLTGSSSVGGFIDDNESVEMLNPLSEELSRMRQSPLPATLQAIAYNANRRQKAIKTFEFGRIYQKNPDGSFGEQSYLCIAVWGQQEPTWQGKSEGYSFYDVSATVHKLLSRLGIKAVYKEASYPSQFSDSTSLYVGKKEVVVMGQVQTALTKEADVKGPVYAAVLWWDTLLKFTASPAFKAVEPPKFPEVRRDLSLVVNASVTYAEMQTMAMEAEKKLLKDVQLFDIFSGESLGEGKKAYALAFTLSAQDATLTEAQIDAAMQRLEKSFVEKLGASVRR